MKRRRRGGAWFLAAAAMAVAVAGAAGAYELSRVTFSGGTPSGASGPSTLRGSTAGEAGPVGAVSGSGYGLGLGFWAGFISASGLTSVGPAESDSLPHENALRQNSPNPFGPATSIAYSVSRPSHVRLAVYDVSGRRVATLVDESASPGVFASRWDGQDDGGRSVASGIYYYRIDIGPWSATRRMLKLR